MTGRFEEELKTEVKIKNTIEDKPDVIKSYYNSFIDETYNTKYNYINHVCSFVEFMYKTYGIDFNDYNQISKIKMFHINDYINKYSYKEINGRKIKNTNSYKANKLSALRNFFEFLCNNEFIDNNPCLKIKTPKDKRMHKIVSLSEDEIQTIKMNIMNGVGSERAIKYQKKYINRDMLIVILGITTGLRVSAICNINVQDIDYDKNVIMVVEKGNIEKEVRIPVNIFEYINKWLNDREKILEGVDVDALFITSQKKRISTNGVRAMLNKYTYNIDKHITPHKLRSTTATTLLKKTNDIYLVAEVLGHKNIQNTKRYAELSDIKKIEAANIMGSII